MKIYVNFFVIFILSFCLDFKQDFIICVNFSRIAASKQQVMTSQIKSHIDYLIQTYYFLVLIL